MSTLNQSYNNILQRKYDAESMFNIMPRGRLGINQTLREQTTKKISTEGMRLLRMERDKNENYEEQQYRNHLIEVYLNKIPGDDEFSVHVTKILSVSSLTCKEKVKLIEETGRIVEENEQIIRFRDTESTKPLPYIPGYL
jgi:hypothetical protein